MQIINFNRFNYSLGNNTKVKVSAFTNPINFKGVSKSDTFEHSSEVQEQNVKSDSTKSKADEIQARIDAEEEKNKQLNDELERLKQEYLNLKNEREKLVEEEKKKNPGRSFEPWSTEIDKKSREIYKKWNDCKRKTKEFSLSEKKLENLKKYLEALLNDPDSSFLFDPDITLYEKKQMAACSENVSELMMLSYELGVPQKVVEGWIKAGILNVIKINECGGIHLFINKKQEDNQTFLAEVKKYIPTSVVGGEFASMANLREQQMRDAYKNGEIRSVGFTGKEKGVGFDFMLFDLEDELNKAFIQTRAMIKPFPSEYYKSIGTPGAYIPASYLQKLGFANVSDIRQMIQSGKIRGVVQTKKTDTGVKTRTLMDVSSADRTFVVLTTLRDNNPDTLSLRELAQELGVKQSVIKDAVQNGELEIVHDYLFYEDSKTLYFKKSDPKNQQFIEKVLFDKMIAEELAQKEREELAQARIDRKQGQDKIRSLKLAITWSYCPNTKVIGSKIAKEDGYLCSLLAKENNDEELTRKEQIKVNSYRKKMWQVAGSQEFSAARRKAEEYVSLYLEDGIDAVPDKNAREIIMRYFG